MLRGVVNSALGKLTWGCPTQFTIAELEEALTKGSSNLGEPAPEGYKEGSLRLPPHTAIANQLMKAVVDKWGFSPKM